MSKDSTDYFIELNINSRIYIYGYNHGLPIVSLLSGPSRKKHTITIPLQCSKYLCNNDSLVKVSGVNKLKVVRDSANSRVITYWGSFKDPNKSQLIQRKIISI